MSNITKKFYQRCDFCKKEYELIKADLSEQPYMLDSISLPGYATSKEAPRTRAIVGGSICDSCMDRLRKILEPYLRLVNAEYCGEIIEWKEEKQE